MYTRRCVDCNCKVHIDERVMVEVRRKRIQLRCERHEYYRQYQQRKLRRICLAKND